LPNNCQERSKTKAAKNKKNQDKKSTAGIVCGRKRNLNPGLLCIISSFANCRWLSKLVWVAGYIVAKYCTGPENITGILYSP